MSQVRYTAIAAPKAKGDLSAVFGTLQILSSSDITVRSIHCQLYCITVELFLRKESHKVYSPQRQIYNNNHGRTEQDGSVA
jgi:hypothetical protein